jgi:hypothetical protein
MAVYVLIIFELFIYLCWYGSVRTLANSRNQQEQVIDRTSSEEWHSWQQASGWTWLPSTAGWSVMGYTEQRRNPHSQVCRQMLGVAFMEVQWQIWTFGAIIWQSMAPPATRKWPIHNGSSHWSTCSQLKMTLWGTMLPALPTSYNVSQHHQQCWHTSVRVGY